MMLAANRRAIFEVQMMSMRLHSAWMKVSPEKIYATGGASNDLALLQGMADVTNCRVLRIEISKSAAHGCRQKSAMGKLVAGFSQPIPNSEIRPDKKAAKIYGKLLGKYAVCESEALQIP